MLKVAISEYNQTIGDIIKSFPAQLLVVAEELIQDLIRTGRVDIAFVPKSDCAERRYAHRIINKYTEWMIVSSSSISSENHLLLEAFLLRLNTSFNAENKYLMRLVSSLDDADNILNLLKAAFLTDVFMVKSESLARFETVTDYAAYYDILTQLHDAGARQIALIPIEKIY